MESCLSITHIVINSELKDAGVAQSLDANRKYSLMPHLIHPEHQKPLRNGIKQHKIKVKSNLLLLICHLPPYNQH